MKLTPFQLGLLAVGSFASIVLLNVLAKAQSNEAFRESLTSGFSPAALSGLRDRLKREERMEPIETPNPDPVAVTEEETNG